MRLSSLLLAGVVLAGSLLGVVRAEDKGKIPPPVYKIDSIIVPADPTNTTHSTKREFLGDEYDSLPDLSRRLDRRVSQNGNPASYAYYFKQRIDHENPGLGTFNQRYFFSDEYWGGKGYPIIIMNVGEQEADNFYSYLTGYTIMRALLIKYKAAGVILEHRYYGESSPYTTLSTANLKYLTLDQSMEDMKYFVENVKLPWAPSAGEQKTDPEFVPWIHLGCSYPGLLAAYIQQKYPDLFAASWSSSAPVQADSDFWEYYNPIEEGMPKNCSSDAGKVITYVDSIISGGDPAKILQMKTKFGMQNSRNDDFAQSIARVFWNWQGMQAYSFQNSGYDSFYRFCDALETKNGKINKSKDGIGLPWAYDNYAAYFKQWYSDWYCPGGACFSTYDYNSPMYKDWSVRNWANRQWYWFICTEFGWFQTGDPGNLSKIVSKYVTVAYTLRQCSHMFPRADGSLPDYYPDIYGNNKENKGWNLKAPQLFVTNGEYDPWRSASLSSKYGPKYKKNKNYQKVVVIKNGHHCWDFSSWNADLNKDVRKVVNTGLKQLQAWLMLWYLEHPFVDEPTGLFPGLNDPAGYYIGGDKNTASTTDTVEDHTDNTNGTANVNGTVNTPGGHTGTKGVVSTDPAVVDEMFTNTNGKTVGSDDVNTKPSGILASRPLVYTSLGLNAALLLALLVIVGLYFWNRRKQNKKSGSGGKYFAVGEDKLGEYKPTLMGGDKMRPLSLGSSKELYSDEPSESKRSHRGSF